MDSAEELGGRGPLVVFRDILVLYRSEFLLKHPLPQDEANVFSSYYSQCLPGTATTTATGRLSHIRHIFLEWILILRSIRNYERIQCNWDNKIWCVYFYFRSTAGGCNLSIKIISRITNNLSSSWREHSWLRFWLHH